ncbi:MAG TPA: hypothetical protein DDW40_10205, partial [Exiguobacterium sp.]|nr:hypothetical protein [Exiguobacterium sp.]
FFRQKHGDSSNNILGAGIKNGIVFLRVNAVILDIDYLSIIKENPSCNHHYMICSAYDTDQMLIQIIFRRIDKLVFRWQLVK